jgi:hypothetical protein
MTEHKITRRGLIGAIICAPVIVQASSSLMPVKAWHEEGLRFLVDMRRITPVVTINAELTELAIAHLQELYGFNGLSPIPFWGRSADL